jgi:hypothetical protein
MSAVMAAPDSSPLGTKPRAPLSATSLPKSQASRLEVSTMAVAVAFQAAGDREAVGVGQLNVEEHHLRTQPLRRRQRGRSVLRLAHHIESLRLEQHPHRRPKARVIVDDQDGWCHEPIVPHAVIIRHTAIHTPESAAEAGSYGLVAPLGVVAWVFASGSSCLMYC